MDMDEIRRDFGGQLWKLMELNDLTIRTFAEGIGMTPEAVRKLISGRFPSVENLIKIARFLNTDVSTLLGERELPSPEEVFERDVQGYMRLTGRSRKAALWDRKLIRWKETEKEIE